MNTSTRLRQLADRMGLDGFAEELREIAGELDAKAAPAVPRDLPSGMATSQADGKWRVTLEFDVHSDAAALHDYMLRNGVPSKSMVAAPAVPQGIPAQEVIDSIEAWKSAWLKVPPFADRVNKATREAITISHNSLFLLLQSAQQAQRMPAGCTTPTGCGRHGCHGACIAAAPSQPVTLTEWISVDERLPDGEPGDPAIEFYNEDLRNPTRQVIGIYRDGVWYSGGHQFSNVTYWKPLTPAPIDALREKSGGK